MRHNFEHLIREELVKRFENVVNEEVRRHNLIVEAHSKDLQHVKNLFENLLYELENLKTKNTIMYQDTQNKFLKEKEDLETTFEFQRRQIRENIKKTDDKLKFFEEAMAQRVEREEFNDFAEKVKNTTEFLAKKDIENHEVIKQVLEKVRKEIKMESLIFSDNQQKIIDSLLSEIISLKKQLEAYKVDSVGVLKELQVYKKSMFIIEKKIENLYTLLDRVNTRL